MGTVENPDVFIQHYEPGIGWREHSQEAKSFIVRHGGIRKIPVANVTLKNVSYVPELHDLFRINVDVRGVQDQLIYGRVKKIKRKLVPGSKSIIYELKISGLEERLLRDTITVEYEKLQRQTSPFIKWTYAKIIQDFLALGDSGYNTNILLEVWRNPILVFLFNQDYYDYSGNMFNGSPIGSFSWTTGKHRNALVFNGTDTEVQVANQTELNPTRITISLWVKVSAFPIAPNYAQLIGKYGQYALRLLPDGRIYWMIDTTDAGGGVVELTSVKTLSLGTWHHVVALYDGSKMKIYIDKVGIETSQILDIDSGTNPVAIGAREGAYYFDGALDSIVMFNRALTEDEIAILYADSMEIYLPPETNCNFSQESLLDALRRIAESIDYEGYVWIDEAGQAFLRFCTSGSLNANPAVTFEEPFTDFEDENNIEDYKNYILVKGGADKGVPSDGDKVTEHVLAKYSGSWVGRTGVTVEDSKTRKKLGDYSLKISRTTEDELLGVTLNLGNVEIGSVSANVRTAIFLFAYPEPTGLSFPEQVGIGVFLTDYIGNQIGYVFSEWLESNKWNRIKIPLPSWATIRSKENAKPQLWYLETGSTFNLEYITQAELVFFKSRLVPAAHWLMPIMPTILEKNTTCQVLTGTVYIDGFYFIGGKEIVPDTDNPPVKDQTNIDEYGISTHWLIDQDIDSFEMATAEGYRELNVLKDPVYKVEFWKRAFPWVKPNELITVNISRLGLSNQKMKVLEVEHRWHVNERLITGISAIKETARIPPVFPPRRGEKPYPPPPIDWRWVS